MKRLGTKWNCKQIPTSWQWWWWWQNDWHYIYDSDRHDKVLTWTNKWFVYPKRKNDTTFPKHVHQQPQTSPTNKRHPTTTTMATPTNHSKPQRQTEQMDKNLLTMVALDCLQDIAQHYGNQHQQHRQWKQHIQTKQKVKPKQAANTFTSHPRQPSKDNPKQKDSHWSIKWQPREWLKIWWTKKHLDSYLALTEVTCEWNTEPG
jgi:hypothetical protein